MPPARFCERFAQGHHLAADVGCHQLGLLDEEGAAGLLARQDQRDADASTSSADADCGQILQSHTVAQS